MKKTIFLVTLLLIVPTIASAIVFDYPIPESNYIPGSYNGRSFYYNPDSDKPHIGEDIYLAVKTPIRAIADGRIVQYEYHQGYATSDDGTSIAAVIEHDLGTPITFQLQIGNTKTVTVDKVCSIYGHIRKSEDYDGTRLQWQVDQEIKKGEIIGYINDDAHNGDGSEHLHMGMRLGGHPGWWVYYGYENSSIADSNVSNFASATEIIDQLRCSDTPANQSLARIEDQGTTYWIQNGIKYYIISPTIFSDMLGIPGWCHICDFPAATLDSYQNGIDGDGTDFIGTSSTSDKLLIKLINDPKVYLIENGKRRWITSGAVFNQLGYDWNDVIEVSETILNSIPVGNNILSRKGLPWIGLLLTDDVPGEKILRVPARYPTIQAAIDAASNGDTVLVADGTYTGVGNKNIDFNGKAITVKSENGPDNCIIDCGNDGRGFHFHNGETSESVVNGFTISHGKIIEQWSGGGGIFLEGSSPTISNCIISQNSISHGYGGGIYCINGASPIIDSCIIINNSASANGGGIRCFSNSSPIITNCTIIGNSAGAGGAIELHVLSSPMIVNCTITGNSATEGGAIFCYYLNYPTIKNSILWNNSAATGSEIAIVSSENPSTITVSYSDIQGGQAATYVESNCKLDWDVTSNIDSNPLFVSNEDYHLTSGSPCMDTGTAESAPNTDIEDIPRPQGNGYDMGAYEFH